MLILSRRPKESVVIGGAGSLRRLFRVTILEIRGNSVKLGFEIDADVPVHRHEIWEKIQSQDRAGPALA